MKSDRNSTTEKSELYWLVSQADFLRERAKGRSPNMRRNVESLPHSAPVDAHERSRDYLFGHAVLEGPAHEAPEDD